ASDRHNQDANGCNPLCDEDAAEGRHRDGPQCAGLQSYTCTEHRWHRAADGGNQGVTRPDFGFSLRPRDRPCRSGVISLHWGRNRKKMLATDPRASLRCNQSQLKNLLAHFHTAKTHTCPEQVQHAHTVESVTKKAVVVVT